MKKNILGLLTLALVVLGTTAFAKEAQYNVTSLVGYQFQTKNVINKQEQFQGEAQKNDLTFGIQATKVLSASHEIGMEYLRTDSNVNSWQLGFVYNQDLAKYLYTTAGVGYTEVDTPRAIESAYVNGGVGVKVPLTDVITLRTEARGQYTFNENQWTPVALVSLQFKTF